MSIKKILQLTMLTVICASGIVVFAVFMASRQMNTSLVKESRYANVVRKLSALNTLKDDYLLNKESRPLEQWQNVYKSLGILLEEIQPQNDDEKSRVNALLQHYQELNIFFSQLIAIEEASNQSNSNRTELKETLNRLLSVKISAMFDESSRLAQESQINIIAEQQKTNLAANIIVFMMLALSCGVLFLMSHKITTSIQKLHEGTMLISQGNLDRRVEIDGVDEIAKLAEAFNVMANHLEQDITRRKQAENEISWNLDVSQTLSSLYIPIVTAGVNIEEIANIILEKSRQLTNSSHGYVAEVDPSTGDLIAHTLTGMMETECKLAEETLRKTVFHRKADGLYNGLWGHALNTREPFYTNVPVKHDTSSGIPEGHIVIERFLSVPVLLGGELVGQIALSNSLRDYTNRDLNAVNRIAEFYALAIQHKRAEHEALRLASFPMLNPMPIMEVDMEGQVSFANIATRRIFPDLEERGASHPWLVDWELLVSACRDKGMKPDDRDVAVADRWYHQTMYHVPEERHLRIYGFDITERKRAEEALVRMNRELRAISNCNQVLVRAENEQNLLNDICRIVCDEAGYRMAWVGYAENDDAKTIRPVAWAGTEDGYLEQAGLIWADTERGHGPAGTAIRSGKSACIQDFAADHQAAPWRENALQRGYRSCISLPLNDERANTFGILTIYSTEQNAFTQDEMRILEELSGDLAFGIVVLRTRTERKQVEEDLRRMNERFSLATSAARLGVWDWDIQKNELVWDDRMSELYGIKREDFAGAYEAWLKGVHPDDRAGSNEISKRAQQGECEYDTEFRVVWPDCSIHYLKAYGQIVRDADGRPLRMTGINFDITERKMAEQAIYESQQVFRTMVESSPDIIARYDHDCRRTYVNPVYLRVAQMPRQELITTSPIQCSPLPSSSAVILQNLISKVINSGVAEAVDVIWPKSDNIDYWYNVYAFPEFDREGQVISVMTISRDITERKRIERALEESEAKIRSILDNIGSGVILISHDMEILEINKRMRQWFPDIIPGQHPFCYNVLNDSPCNVICEYCPAYKTLQDGLTHEATIQRRQAGVLRDQRVVSSPVLNQSGKVTAAILMIEDITDKLSLESQFHQAQKMESVGRLAGGVAHDFNNMLGVIIGHVDLFIDQIDQDEPIFVALQEIRKAAERSANLTRQLLAFARKQTVTPRVIDLNDTIEVMLKMLRRLLGEDIDLAWIGETGVWPIKIDPSQIDQILANLCVNARDAIEGVGKITIETHQVTFDEEYCANHPEFIPGNYVMLAVSDDGCGMDRETMDKIFEPFFTTKEMGKGTGLGLATIYGIVRQNNGFINVYSEPGHGTTFKIYIPQHMAKTGQMIKESQEAPSTPGNETILLVEDESAILNMGRLILERLGYRVLAASTPGEAIRMAGEHTGEIHLLITDVVMPEMNGRELMKNIETLCPEIRHLFMSGYTANVIAHHGVVNDGINFIQKPFSMKAIAAKVREVLDDK